MAKETHYYKLKSLSDFTVPYSKETVELGEDGQYEISFFNTNEKALQIDTAYFVLGMYGQDTQTKGNYTVRIYENDVYIGILRENGL